MQLLLSLTYITRGKNSSGRKQIICEYLHVNEQARRHTDINHMLAQNSGMLRGKGK